MVYIARNIKIKVARAELDMTQKALADAVGISRQTINSIEQSNYNPKIEIADEYVMYWVNLSIIFLVMKNENKAEFFVPNADRLLYCLHHYHTI